MGLKMFINRFMKPWFFSKDDRYRIKPIRAAITITLVLIFTSVIIKMVDPKWLSDTFVLGMIGQMGFLLGADTWRSNSKDRNGKNS